MDRKIKLGESSGGQSSTPAKHYIVALDETAGGDPVVQAAVIREVEAFGGTVYRRFYAMLNGGFAATLPNRALEALQSNLYVALLSPTRWSGPYVSTIISGMDVILGEPGGVVTMAFGTGPNISLDSAARQLEGAGHRIVTAAGNTNSDACDVSPARDSSTITAVAHVAGVLVLNGRSVSLLLGDATTGVVDDPGPGSGLRRPLAAAGHTLRRP